MLFSVINPSDFISFNKNEEETNQDNQNEVKNESQIIDANSQPQIGRSKIEGKIEKAFKLLTKTFNFIGPLFTISLLCFIFFTYIAAKKTIVYYYRRRFGRKVAFCITLINSIQLLYITFNYLLAAIIKPGSVKDILKSSYYKSNDPYKTSKISFPAFDIPLNSREERTFCWKKCKDCKVIKPLRTHHCTICGACVMKMDHHCPWINNCVGQNNQRYFLLFLVFLLSYSSFNAGLSIPMIVNGEYSRMENEFRFICVLSIAGSCVLLFFSLWNWFLAFNGNTTLEFWGSKVGIDVGDGLSDFDFGNWRDNLYYIFGTRNIFEIIFVPSITKLPFSGLEWSKYVDSSFHIEEDINTDIIAISIDENNNINEAKNMIELENK